MSHARAVSQLDLPDEVMEHPIVLGLGEAANDLVTVSSLWAVISLRAARANPIHPLFLVVERECPACFTIPHCIHGGGWRVRILTFPLPPQDIFSFNVEQANGMYPRNHPFQSCAP